MVLSTNIPKLDELLDGGLQENKSVLLLAQPGVHSLEFAQQLFYNCLQECEGGIYFVNNKPPQAVREQFHSYDWDLGEIEKKQKLLFIDCFSFQISQPSTEKYAVEKQDDIESISSTISKAIKQIDGGQTILIFDSLSSLLDNVADENPISDIKKRLETESVASIFLFTSWLYPQQLINKFKQLFDCVIELKAVERKVIVRDYFTVSKASWMKKRKQRGVKK